MQIKLNGYQLNEAIKEYIALHFGVNIAECQSIFYSIVEERKIDETAKKPKTQRVMIYFDSELDADDIEVSLLLHRDD